MRMMRVSPGVTAIKVCYVDDVGNRRVC
jgi:hypothetical protein